MKILLKNKIMPLVFLIIVVLLLVFYGLGVKANSYDDSGLVIKGNHLVLDTDELSSEHNINFTFTTTDSQYKGFLCGTYVLQYDPSRLDIDVDSIKQRGGMAPTNTDYNVFTINGQPAQEGMILIGFASTVPNQEHDLNFKVKNLFKDGNNSPIEINILNRSEDPLTVADTLDQPYAPKTPIVKKATISLAPMKIDIQGSNELKVGSESKYNATVKNFISNDKVNWSVTHAASTQTKIDENGNLFIGEDETSTTIQVIATSQENPNISISKQVQVILKVSPSIDIDGKKKVIKGTKDNIYKSVVKNINDTSVIWSLSGQTSTKTSIDNNGQLIVGVDEASLSIDIVATSQENQLISKKYNVQLIDKTYTISQVKLKTDKVSIDTTQKLVDLKEHVSVNKIALVTIVTNDGGTYEIEVPISDYSFNKIISKEETLLAGDYKVIYNLKLPYMLVDHNGNITVNDKKTNIIGDDRVQIPLTITTKEVVKSPVVLNKRPPMSTNGKDKVKTSDSNDVMTNIIALTSSVVLFVISKSRKVGKQKK